MSYHAYAARLAREARVADQKKADAKIARRQALQPQYEAVGQWQREQIAAHGITPQILAETQRRLDALDAQVRAA